MRSYDIILEVPENLDITALNPDGSYVIGNDVVIAISDLLSVWPGGIINGTEPVNGLKVCHANIKTSSELPVTLVQSLIDNFSLDWAIMLMQSRDTDVVLVEPDSKLITYVSRRLEYSESGTVIGQGPDPELSWMGVYLGMRWSIK